MQRISRISTALVTLTIAIIAIVIMCCSTACKQNESSDVRIGSFYGPTGISLIYMPDEGYSYESYTQTDAMISDFAAGKIDVALLPANIAANIHNKTDFPVTTLNINTLGVVELLSQNDNIQNLNGRPFYCVGKGTVVEGILRVFLDGYNIKEEECNIQYKSSAAEVINYLNEDPEAIGLVNEPQATLATQLNPNIKQIYSTQEMWKDIFKDDSDFLTAITVVNKNYFDKNYDKIKKFMSDYKKSIETVNSDYAQAAKTLNDLKLYDGITFTPESIKKSNLVCIEGQEMKSKLTRFLSIISSYNDSLIGGHIPGDDFYYIDE